MKGRDGAAPSWHNRVAKLARRTDRDGRKGWHGGAQGCPGGDGRGHGVEASRWAAAHLGVGRHSSAAAGRRQDNPGADPEGGPDGPRRTLRNGPRCDFFFTAEVQETAQETSQRPTPSLATSSQTRDDGRRDLLAAATRQSRLAARVLDLGGGAADCAAPLRAAPRRPTVCR